MPIDQRISRNIHTVMGLTKNIVLDHIITSVLHILLYLCMGCGGNNTATALSSDTSDSVGVSTMGDEMQTPSTRQQTTIKLLGCLQRDTIMLILSNNTANIIGLSDGDSVALKLITQVYQQYQDGREIGYGLVKPDESESNWFKNHLSSFYGCYVGSDDADDEIAFREAMLDVVAKSIANGYIHSSVADDLYCSYSPFANDIIRYNTRIISTECWSFYIDSLKDKGEDYRFLLAEMYILGDTVVHAESLDDIAEYLEGVDYAISRSTLDSFRRRQPNSYEILSLLLN